MTKDVIVTISGVQHPVGRDGEDEPIELMTTGTYAFDAGRHVVEYDEVFEDIPGVTHNIVTFGPDGATVHKDGQANVDMVFEVGKTNIACYETPYGGLDMSFTASSVNVEEEEERLSMMIDYALSLNGQYVADCSLAMQVTSRLTSRPKHIC